MVNRTEGRVDPVSERHRLTVVAASETSDAGVSVLAGSPTATTVLVVDPEDASPLEPHPTSMPTAATTAAAVETKRRVAEAGII